MQVKDNSTWFLKEIFVWRIPERLQIHLSAIVVGDGQIKAILLLILEPVVEVVQSTPLLVLFLLLIFRDWSSCGRSLNLTKDQLILVTLLVQDTCLFTDIFHSFSLCSYAILSTQI